jgi:serine/threonine-protein kinase
MFVGGPSLDVNPSFSPDGRWLAYASNESGRMEVYVRPFPVPGGKWLISTGGGNHPIWSLSKPELFFAADDQLMVASYAVEGNAFRADRPRLWSEGRIQTRGPNRMFDLHPDGERFALAPAEPTPGRSRQDTVVVIFNFFDELRRVAAGARR